MSKSRFILHPVLANHRSRRIFYIFIVLSCIVGSWLWWESSSILKGTGIIISYDMLSNNRLLDFLMSVHFRLALIVGGAILASGLTAHYVIGPIKRMEQWLLDQENGRNSKPLRVRKGDKFSHFVDLLNQFFQSK